MQIDNYKMIPIRRCNNLTNKIFGDFKVLYRTEVPSTSHSKQAYWLCQCLKCNKFLVKSAFILTKGENKCECNNDLTGKKIGKWTVLYLCEERTYKRGKIYHCKCECGNEKDVSAEVLNKGESKSCGCINKEKRAERCKQMRLDLTGQRFGKLVALYPYYSGDKNIHTKWHCKCDCGNECDIDMGNLRGGKSQSCGCTSSKHEENIIRLLIKNNINFIYQYRFNNFKLKEFDFYVENKYIIEYDGQQHFEISGGWSTEENLKRTHQSDLEKNKYCFDNSIPIIRIPYNAEYDINDLKLETTRFLLTPENEQEYYKNIMI